MISNNPALVLPSFSHYSTAAHDIKKMVLPLNKLGIVLFSHTQIYKDKFIDISDREDMIDYFYYQSDLYKYYVPDTHPYAIKNGYFLCTTLRDNPSIDGLRDDLEIDNIISLVEKYDDHYNVWHFGARNGNDSIVNFYLNNLNFLKSFAYSFSTYAKDIIEDSLKDPFYYKEKLPPLDCALPDTNFVNDLPTGAIIPLNIEINGNNIALTKTEVAIIKLILNGKSSACIAGAINRSPKTIQRHIENIKEKFNCHKITEVIQILILHDLAKTIMLL